MNKIFFIFFFSFFVNSSTMADTTKIAKGKSIFLGKGMCAGCHTLKEAESYSNIGPSLDLLELNISLVTSTVMNGIGVMPAFGSTKILTADEIESVSFYVVNSVGKN